MAKLTWFKGNLHTHTTESDGDAEPARVVSWYRRQGYDFLVLSDHNHRTVLDYAGRRRFRRPLMIPGEEVSASIGQGTVPVHVGGIGISMVVEPIDAGDVVSTLQANINSVVEADGIAAINHPNGVWAFDHREIRQVSGASLLEVYNGWPGSNTEGAPGRFSGDEIWDGVLSAGKVIFGVATDDAHHYSDFSHLRANPGRGWVVARAEELSQDAIVEALAKGEFYFSTGVHLTEVEMSSKEIRIEIEQFGDHVYTTAFTGRNGRVLREIEGLHAAYVPEGDESYVRARVRSSMGARAWTQPVFV